MTIREAMNTKCAYLATARVQQIGCLTALCMLIVSVTVPASASTFEVTGPSTSADNYTVALSGCKLIPETMYCRIEERIGQAGAWTSVGSGSVEFTDKLPGQCYYRGHEYTFYIGEQNGEPYPVSNHYYTSEIQVIITGGSVPEVESYEEQRQYTYQARVGFINSDTHTDLYVRRTSGGTPQNGSIDSVILMANGDGTFYKYLPSVAQDAEATSLPVANVDFQLDDINADGFVDVLVKNLNSVIPGALNQIVFAPGEMYSSNPKGVRKMDSELTDLSNELMSFYSDDNYFEDVKVVDVYPAHWDYDYECYFGWNSRRQRNVYQCEWISVWVAEEIVTTYPGRSNDAVDFWEKLQSYRNGTVVFQDVVDIVESVLGVEIGIPSACFDFPGQFVSIDDDVECQGIQLGQVILALSRTEQEADDYFGRPPGKVYVTAHKILSITWGEWQNIGPNIYHSAIEYRPIDITLPVQNPITEMLIYSAECLPKEICYTSSGDGKLTKGYRRLEDLPQVNLTVAVVEAEPTVLLLLKSGFTNYNDCLKYRYKPSTSSPQGYNSNSFTAGLLNYSTAVPDFSVAQIPVSSMSAFPGGGVPVPSIHFSDPPPCE